MICFNDDAAVGTLHAANDTGLDRSLLVVGQGADRRLRAEMRKPNSPIVGATAFRPEDYGKPLVQLALDILSEKRVYPAVFMEHYFVSPANVNTFYPKELEYQN